MLYDVKRISFCPTRYWPTVAVASSRGGALEYQASLVRTEYYEAAAASALDARTAAWYIRTGTAVPVGAPTAVDILASFPPVRGLVFGSTACGGSREVGVLLAQAASSVVVSPASVALAWRPLHARRAVLHDLDASLSGRLRRGRCACPSRLSRLVLELIGGSALCALAAPPAVTHLPRAPSFRRPPSSRHGEALWERVEAGSGSLGAASSESAAGSGRLWACGCSCGSS